MSVTTAALLVAIGLLLISVALHVRWGSVSVRPLVTRSLRFARPVSPRQRVLDPLEARSTAEWIGSTSMPVATFDGASRRAQWGVDDAGRPMYVAIPSAALEPPRPPGRHATEQPAGPLDDWTLIHGEDLFAEIVAEHKAAYDRKEISA